MGCCLNYWFFIQVIDTYLYAILCYLLYGNMDYVFLVSSIHTEWCHFVVDKMINEEEKEHYRN